MSGDWRPIASAPCRQWVRVKHPDFAEPGTMLGRRDYITHWWTVKAEGEQFQWTLRGYDPTEWQPIPEQEETA